jgi:Na+-translocating ferredoxin:NAD+ oxidoreductase RnfA subunit
MAGIGTEPECDEFDFFCCVLRFLLFNFFGLCGRVGDTSRIRTTCAAGTVPVLVVVLVAAWSC